MATKITRDVIESYLNCKYKGHLKLTGESGTISDYEAMTTAARASSREQALTRLAARSLHLQPLVELAQDRHRQVLAHPHPLRVAEVLGLPLQLVKLPVIGQRLVRPQRVAAPRLVELAPRVRVAGHLDDACRRRPRVGQVQSVVAAEGVRVQVAPVLGQEPLGAVAPAVVHVLSSSRAYL
jgi:hypothetical protein